MLTRCYSSVWLLHGWGGLTTPFIACLPAFDLWGPRAGSLLICWLGKTWFFLHFLFPAQPPAGKISDLGPNSWSAWRSELQRFVFHFHHGQHTGPCPTSTTAHSVTLLPSLFLCDAEFLLSSGPETKHKAQQMLILIIHTMFWSSKTWHLILWLSDSIVQSIHQDSGCTMATCPMGKGHCIKGNMA